MSKSDCKHCGAVIEGFRGLWWTGNDFMCPDGERQHEPQQHAPTTRNCLQCGKDLTDVMGVCVFVRTGLEFNVMDGLLCLEHGANGENTLSAGEYERLTGDFDDGTSGQDRESYSDDQDRDSYSPDA